MSSEQSPSGDTSGDTHETKKGASSADEQAAATQPAEKVELTPEQRRGCLRYGTGSVLLLAVLAAAWFAGPGILAVLESVFRGHLHVWAVVLLAAIPLLFAARAARRAPKAKGKARGKGKAKAQGKGTGTRTGSGLTRGATTAVTASVLAGLVGLGYLIGVHGWLTASAYSRDVTYVEQPTDFLPRAPWVVAENYASRDQGEIVGDRLTTHYVPREASDEEQRTSRYTTLVNRRAFLGLAGMEAVHEVHTPIRGTVPGDASRSCAIPASMGATLGSFWPWHSLRYAIWMQNPLAHWNAEDAYGYCDGENPVVVAPMWAWDGLWPATKRPAGAAVYTVSGLSLLTPEQLTEQGIQGPTYPRSLAEQQRSALRGDGTLFGYWSSVTGFDTTEKDSEDANLGNTSEFTLVTPQTGGRNLIEYVTPLTPRGSSESITALSIVPAQQRTSGRSPIMVNTSTDLPATSTLATRIREASVQGDPQWTTRWAAGMSVYEILPEREGFWAASIGQGQAVSYRAAIAPDGSVSVTNVETGASTTTPPSSGTGAAPGGTPLAEMSRAELLQLILDATRELQEKEAAAAEPATQ